MRVDVNRGGPGNPLSADELAIKFRINTSHRLTEDAAARVAEATFDLPNAASTTELMSLVK